MSTFKHTGVIDFRLENGRVFEAFQGEIFEIVAGEGFICKTKVVVREDFLFVSRQLALALEI